jgi:hypothetical protein
MNKKYDNNNIIIASRAYFLHKVDFQLVVHCTVHDHVCAGRVTFFHNLLGDEVRIAMDLDAGGATGFCHMHAV